MRALEPPVMPERSLRVLFLGFADRDIFCAQDLSAREVALRLDPARFESYVFVRRADPDPRLVSAEHVHLIRPLAIGKVRGLQMLATMLFGHFDVIVSGKLDRLDVLYLKLRRFCRDRKVHVHTVENLRPAPSGKAFDDMAKFLALRSDYTFAISKKISATSQAWCGRHFDLMHAIGIDQLVYFPNQEGNGKRSGQKQIVGCGSLCERKRPDLFVDIARSFPTYRFIWVGNGEMKEAIRSKIAREHIENVEILDYMFSHELAEHYRRSTVFLFPSIHEGFPKVVVEAMACGLPAIVCDHYGPEAVVDGETGFVVHDRSEMEARLDFLLRDDLACERMGQAAVARARWFTWDKIARNYEDVLTRVCSGRADYTNRRNRVHRSDRG